jgi:hypothetical protein
MIENIGFAKELLETKQKRRLTTFDFARSIVEKHKACY